MAWKLGQNFFVLLVEKYENFILTIFIFYLQTSQLSLTVPELFNQNSGFYLTRLMKVPILVEPGLTRLGPCIFLKAARN